MRRFHVDGHHVVVLVGEVGPRRGAAVEQVGVIRAVGRPCGAACGGESDHVVYRRDGADLVLLDFHGQIDHAAAGAGAGARRGEFQRREITVEVTQPCQVALERNRHFAFGFVSPGGDRQRAVVQLQVFG